MLELTVLTVPGCPNAAVIGERLAGVLADYPAARLVRHVVHDEAETARLGMHGSPTLLVNGVDPFAAPGTPVSISCRIYRDESGRAWGAPSVAALRLALRQAAGPSARPGLPGAAGRGGRDRLAPAEGGLRAVHQRVLRAFAETGKPPSAAELDAAAAPFGTDGRTVLALLHAGDFLRLEAGGAISAAYPFSAAPTAHVVQIQDGPAVFSMCAIDALGIAAMLGRPVTISSAEPGTGRPITVTVPAGGGPAVWEPAGAVVYAGQQSSCGTCAESVAPVPPAAADVCCGFISFFTTAASATAWASAHPEITGQTLTSTKPRRPASRSSARFCGPAHERFDNGIIESASTTYGCQMNEVSGRVLAEAVRDRASSDDPLVLLEAAIVVAGETSGAADDLIEHYVGAARAASVSWTVIGEQLGVSRQAARQKFAHRLEVSDVIGDAAGMMVVAPRLSACLQAARAAADADDSVPGTQHLLLGLLHAGAAASILDRLGVTREKVREVSGRLFEPAMIAGGDGEERRVVGDGEAEQAVTGARRLAARRGQSQFRTEHLLFCVALDPGSSARRVLDGLDVDPARIKKELQEWIAPVQRRHRRIGKGKATDRACSFCGCEDLGPLVAGPGVWICGNCAQTALDILRSEPRGIRAG